MKYKIFFIFFCYILLSHPSSGQVYHVDPNNTMEMIPSNLRINSRNSIIVWNPNHQEIVLLYSKDEKTWEKIALKTGEKREFNNERAFLKIFSEKGRCKQYKLSAGYRYAIFWDVGDKVWAIK